MDLIEKIKKQWKIFQKLLLDQFNHLKNAKKDVERVPSKFNGGRGGFVGMDTQKELKDFQSKQGPTKPQASHEDLNQVLDDVLKKPSNSDQGLYPDKKK